MKPPILLKTILDIAFYFFAISIVGAMFFLIAGIYNGTTLIPLYINGKEVTDFTSFTVGLLISQFLIAVLILYTIYLLRKLIRNFFTGKLFTKFQIASLKLIGKLIIVAILAQALLEFIGRLYLQKKASLGIEFDLEYGSFWFVLSIGLFFIFLSKVLQNAKKLKEENELTV